MEAVASCGVVSVSSAPRENLLRRHVIFPRRIRHLVFYNRQPSPFKIMAKKSLLYFVDPDPYENDGISIGVEDDANMEIPKVKKDESRKSSSPRRPEPVMSKRKQLLSENARDELEARRIVTNADDLDIKLRKPGVVYEENRILPKYRPAPSLFVKSRSESKINVTLLEKPEVGKPYKTNNSPDNMTRPVNSPGGMIPKSYKPQPTEYELYYSRPVQVSLNPKPEAMQIKPEISTPAPSIDKSLEERENEPKVLYHPNPKMMQKLPPLRSKRTEEVGINLRKPSISTGDKSDPKPEPEPNPLLDMQMDSTLSSQADQNTQLELKPSLDNREDLRNVLIQESEGLNISDLRKPDVPSDDIPKIDGKSEKNPRTLLNEHGHDDSDLSDIVSKGRDEMAITGSSELDLKPKLESLTETVEKYRREDLSNVLLRKKPKFDAGLQQTIQRTDGSKLIRNGSSDAGSISSEENDWIKVEELLNNSERVIVELTGYDNEGFYATLGSIVGFIPYQNLSLRYKFFDFKSWLRKKGLQPTYPQKVQNIESPIGSLPNLGLDAKISEENQEIGTPASSNSALNGDPLLEYQQEKDAFLSSLIGQKLKVTVTVADRTSKKVIFTGHNRNYEELLNKKRKLMARLKVGDIVKCRISRFMPFGIFVVVDGVSALIPQAEVHFDGILDLLSSLELGQILDARVHQLDYGRERINLSLKGVIQKSDPQSNDFESVIGDDISFGGTLQAAQPEEEWEDVESLIKELEKLEKVDTISKGTFFLSSGLAPTFQVYMAPMVDDKYRLLARFGNKVQEVWVQSSIDQEEMKKAILACTSRIA